MLNDRLAGLKIDRLRSFLAVVRHGTFSAAAEALFLPQPRVSSHVADLERLFGVTLFDRSRHPVTLTDGGRRFLPYAEAVADSLALAANEVIGGGQDGTLEGSVVLGMYPSAAAYCYGELVRRLKASQPGVDLVLWEGSTLELGVALDAGDIDLAIRPNLPAPERVQRLEAEVLWREPLVAVLHEDDPLATRDCLTLAELDQRPIITIGSRRAPRDLPRGFESTSALARAGMLDAVVHRTNQPQTLVSLVRSGLGVGVTNQLAALTSNSAGVRIVTLTGEGCNREVALWRRARMPMSASVAAVAKLCRETALKGDPA